MQEGFLLRLLPPPIAAHLFVLLTGLLLARPIPVALQCPRFFVVDVAAATAAVGEAVREAAREVAREALRLSCWGL